MDKEVLIDLLSPSVSVSATSSQLKGDYGTSQVQLLLHVALSETFDLIPH